MNREFKFRTWVFNDKTMVGPVFCHNVYEFACWGNGFGVWYIDNDGDKKYLQNNEYHIMQFTGLKDKNGVDIYEGDILGLENYDHWIVSFEGGHFNVTNSRNSGITFHIEKHGCLMREVIGNIHQNPELL